MALTQTPSHHLPYWNTHSSLSNMNCENKEMNRETDWEKTTTAKKCQNASFARKLFDLISLEDDATVSWSDDGASFIIHNSKSMEAILGKYFRHAKFKSLVRQLCFYNFQNLSTKKNFWIYKNPYFQRNRPDLLWKLKRQSNKYRPTTSTNAYLQCHVNNNQSPVVPSFYTSEIYHKNSLINQEFVSSPTTVATSYFSQFQHLSVHQGQYNFGIDDLSDMETVFLAETQRHYDLFSNEVCFKMDFLL